MMNECQPFRELLPCYALEALDPDEAKAVEKHLRVCADCRAALEEYRTVGEGLLFAMPCQEPPPRVRARLIAALAKDKPQAETVRRARPAAGVVQWLMGLALVALLILNGATLARLDDLQRQQAGLAQELVTSQKAMSLVAYPDSRTYALSGQAAGTLVLNTDLGYGALFAWKLAPLDEAHTYQIWLIQPDGQRVSGGLFRPEPGQRFAYAVIWSSKPFSDFTGLGVTVEPKGGSPGPTTPRVFGTTF
jgi:anti-sigma-K factor RskA